MSNTLSGGLNGIGVDDILSIDSSTITNYSIGTGAYTWSQPYSNYSITSAVGVDSNSTVNINSDGMTLQESCDIKIGDRSLKDFMDRVEERLGILRPNPELEDKWENLKGLRQAYMDLEKEIIEKEKMWKILKNA